jgi:hypothetical protein
MEHFVNSAKARQCDAFLESMTPCAQELGGECMGTGLGCTQGGLSQGVSLEKAQTAFPFSEEGLP